MQTLMHRAYQLSPLISPRAVSSAGIRPSLLNRGCLLSPSGASHPAMYSSSTNEPSVITHTCKAFDPSNSAADYQNRNLLMPLSFDNLQRTPVQEGPSKPLFSSAAAQNGESKSDKNCADVKRKSALKGATSMPIWSSSTHTPFVRHLNSFRMPSEMTIEVDIGPKASDSKTPIEEPGLGNRKEEAESEKRGDKEENGSSNEQFICRYCEKDFRRPDILSRLASSAWL